jgi:Holliday junction resolvase RusA-like endonuclease
MTLYHFEIEGEAVPKGRPRVLKTGRTFTPAKTKNYEAAVQAHFRRAFPQAQPVDFALEMEVEVIKEIPKSWSKKKQAEALAGRLWPISRPDADNYAKAIMDGLQGPRLAMLDDSQVVKLIAVKKYGPQAKAVVTIKQI